MQQFLPVIHLKARPADLWGDQGIYSNAILDLEIPAFLQIFLPDEMFCVETDIQLKIHGGFREDVMQLYRKSFSATFPQQSTSAHNNCEIFPGVTWRMLEGLLLRNPGTDASLLRDVLLAAICAEWEVDIPAHRFCVLHLNSQYWGVYNLCEKISRSFLKRCAGGESAGFDLIEFKDESDPIVQLGDLKHYNEMIAFTRDCDVSDSECFRKISSFIDVDSFIDWQIAEIYSVNMDWPQNNVMLWRQRSPGGKWRWILFDADVAFGLWDYSRNGHTRDHLAYAMGRGAPEQRPPVWSTFLMRRLLCNNEFRSRFVRRFIELLAGPLTAENVAESIDRLVRAMATEMPQHINRWPEVGRMWEGSIKVLKTFARYRPEHLRSHMLHHFQAEG